jgi:CRISPR-associated protein Csb3
MSELELAGDARVALSHLAPIGLAAILEEAGALNVRVHWDAALDARPIVSATGIDWADAARLVRAHAQQHADGADWTAATIDAGSTGLMSPRIKTRATDAGWRELADRRHEVIDAEVADRHWLDLALIGALGEPAYWRFNQQRQHLPDEGASRWEMKTRNRGEEFVRHRLHPLAGYLAARSLADIEAGLTGALVRDEAGSNATDSRTATGLAAPGPVDNALAWCALWGISQFVVVPRLSKPSRTAGHLPSTARSDAWRRGWFYLPVPVRPIALPRLRTIIASAALAQVAVPVSAAAAPDTALRTEAARAWLLERAIGAIVRFPIGEYGSANAPERRALLGTVVPLGT